MKNGTEKKSLVVNGDRNTVHVHHGPEDEKKKSKYVGVYWNRGKWLVQRKIDNETFSGGSFKNEKSAALRSNSLIYENCDEHDWENYELKDV